MHSHNGKDAAGQTPDPAQDLSRSAAAVAGVAAEVSRLRRENLELRLRLAGERAERERLAEDALRLSDALSHLARRYREEFTTRRAAEAAIEGGKAAAGRPAGDDHRP